MFISSNKHLASRISKDLVGAIFRRSEKKELIDQIATEFTYISKIFEIIKALKKKNYNIKFKIHPFEDPNEYKFFNKEELETGNIHEFLKKVDVVLNLYSSGSIEAFTSDVPVISLKKIISIKRERLTGIISTDTGIKPKNLNDLFLLLKKKPVFLQKKIKTKKNIIRIKNQIDFDKNLNDFVETFIKLKKFDKKNYINFIHLPKYILSEIKSLIVFRGYSLFRFYNPRDVVLLKKYKI